MSKNPKLSTGNSKHTIALYIPTPCHENWNAMTPVEQGRFCQSCAKQVIDFSMMTDQEALNYFSKATGNTCGRFNNDQLQRPLQPTKIEKKKTWWVAAMMPLMLLFEKAWAQKKNTRNYVPPSQVIHDEVPSVMGEVISPKRTAQNIQGIVVQEADQKPIPFAVITAGGEFIGMADSLGRFKVTLPGRNVHKNLLEASADGYIKGGNALPSGDTANYTIALAEEDVKVENIIIPIDLGMGPDSSISYGIIDSTPVNGELIYNKEMTVQSGQDTILCTQTFGFTVNVSPVSGLSIKDNIVNIFSNPVTIYPNPAPRGNTITITFKDEGDYSIQVFDNSGKLITIENCSAIKTAPKMPLNIPAYIATGVYYIRLENKKNKKQYTSKLIVM